MVQRKINKKETIDKEQKKARKRGREREKERKQKKVETKEKAPDLPKELSVGQLGLTHDNSLVSGNVLGRSNHSGRKNHKNDQGQGKSDS